MDNIRSGCLIYLFIIIISVMILKKYTGIWFWIIVGILGIYLFLELFLLPLMEKAKKYDKLKPRLDRIEQEEQELEREKNKLEREKNKWEEKVKQDKKEIEILAKEKSLGFPWLAEAYADYFYLKDLKTADYLKTKSHPAIKSAEKVREIAEKRKIAEKLYRILKYQLNYYENLFPWLIEFKDENIEDIIIQITSRKEHKVAEEELVDPVQKWLTPAEYEKLPTVEKYQLALNRYWSKKKSKWEIGRDYERYIGYLFEKEGWKVYYQGIIEGLEDLGRDLIAKKEGQTKIIQCKCWSQEKLIREKHIFQLLGTVIEYCLKKTKKETKQLLLFPEIVKENKVVPLLITSTKLSEEAKEFAKVLGVEFIENKPFEHYPSVKCNESRRTGEKIYHLPFDQQYDRTLIEEERNECYVWTVKEAEDLGYRRAYRWRGAK